MDRQKLAKFFEENEYGKWRSGEKVSYEILDPAKTEPVTFFGQEIPGEPVKINVDGVSFTVRVIKPEEDAPHKGAHPFVICMHPIQPVDTFKKAGFGLIFMDTREIASDDYKHDGCFYKLYPYGAEKEQTGVLMAWAWGAAKVLDAVKAGLGAEPCGSDGRFEMGQGDCGVRCFRPQIQDGGTYVLGSGRTGALRS